MPNKICLLVDDDADDHEIFTEVLKEVDQNITCLTAVNGLQAIKILEKVEQLPDYIFLDLNMPVMSGIQFLTEIKKNETFDKIPVVIYSTSSFHNDIKQTQQLGGTHFLTKPYSIVSLKDALARILSNDVDLFVVSTIM